MPLEAIAEQTNMAIAKPVSAPKASNPCNYCDRPITPGTAYISPCKKHYCNEKCYDMFTQD